MEVPLRANRHAMMGRRSFGKHVLEEMMRASISRGPRRPARIRGPERHEFTAHESRDAWPGDGGDCDDLARDRGVRRIATINRAKMKAGDGLEEFRDAHSARSRCAPR